MSRTATTMNDIIAYVRELCGDQEPGRDGEEISQYMQDARDDFDWCYGQDMQMGDNPSALALVVDSMFLGDGWIYGN
jgi:hypothetical protein